MSAVDVPEPQIAVDLDAARAAREERARKDGKAAPAFRAGGKTYTLPLECPFIVADAIARASTVDESDDSQVLAAATALNDALVALIGEEPFRDFMETFHASFDDVMELVAGIVPMYGLGPSPKGSRKSGSSSSGTSRRSRPIGRTSTRKSRAGTSARHAGAATA